MSPPLYQRLVDTLMSEFGYDYDATPDIIEEFDLMFDPGNIELVPKGPFNDNQFATGGRVHMQEGGEASKTYEELLADLDTAQADLGDGSVSVTQESPGIEALYRQYGPQISNQLATPIRQRAGFTPTAEQAAQGIEGYGSLLPGATGQNQLQQQAIQMQLNQAGLGTAQFDNTTGGTGAFTGMQGTGTGIAGYQPYLNQATTAANAAQAAAAAGQNAGQAGINQANTMAGLMGGQALARFCRSSRLYWTTRL